MKPDYSLLKSNIPSKIKTKSRTSFDILWQDYIKSSTGIDLDGLTEFDPNRIILETKLSDKDIVHSFFHEFLHAMSDSYDASLTETQVENLEKGFPYFRKFFLILENK